MKDSDMTASSSGGVPPGFRFHPTDEELLQYYLKKKLSFQKFDMEVIREVDLNKMEPWDLQERCRIGSAPQNEWYFFSHKDRKYPTGSRTNRATNAGFWKATGRDKCIRNTFKKIGMRKTLVFYRGRAPHGQKTDWIMHEYRLEDAEDDNLANPAEDGWVVCRVFKKKNFFKVGNEGRATSPNSDQQQLSSIYPVNANQHQPRPSLHRDNLYLLRHQPTNFDVVEPELALHYSPHSHGGLHPPPQYSLFPSHQALIPNHKPLGYDYSPPLQSAPLKHLMSSAAGDQCASGGSDGFRYPQNGEQAGLEVGTGSTQHQQMVGEREDQARMSEWGMLSHMGNDHSSKGVARFEDAASTSSVHINPLSLRGEMDFWGYGK